MSMCKSDKEFCRHNGTQEGFGVRVWGVEDEDTMKRMFLVNVDGMTVNCPDKLAVYLREGNDEIH